MTKLEVLSQCKVEGNVVKLPEGQLDKKLYTEVKNALDKIGGTWKGGKIFGFVFEKDPTELLQDIAGGKKRNIKQEFQFFETPPELSDTLVELADVIDSDIILEPSAGRGSIVKAIERTGTKAKVQLCELMPENRAYLEKSGYVVDWADFIAVNDMFKFTKIIANPPFSNNQDVKHVQKMYNHLLPGGRLVAIISTHWQNFDKNKIEKEFKAWTKFVGARIINLGPGEFKQSGTNTESLIIVINKA